MIYFLSFALRKWFKKWAVSINIKLFPLIIQVSYMTCGDNKPCSKSEVQRRIMKQEQSKNDLYKYELALISEKNNMLTHMRTRHLHRISMFKMPCCFGANEWSIRQDKIELSRFCSIHHDFDRECSICLEILYFLCFSILWICTN